MITKKIEAEIKSIEETIDVIYNLLNKKKAIESSESISKFIEYVRYIELIIKEIKDKKDFKDGQNILNTLMKIDKDLNLVMMEL